MNTHAFFYHAQAWGDAGAQPARSETDRLLAGVADYVAEYRVDNGEALQTARYCLMDSLGCGLLALGDPACGRLLGPSVPGASLPGGARVPGTAYELEPVRAAFNLGALFGWLECQAAWLGAETVYPGDTLGGILALADYLSRRAVAEGRAPLHMREVLESLVKAGEIQGVLALDGTPGEAGLDSAALFTRLAVAAVAARLLGGGRADILSALSHAWLDGGPLRVYRAAPHAGPRRHWAAGDAAARGVALALLALRGEPGYPAALSAPRWGVQDALLQGQPLVLRQSLGSAVLENVLFQTVYPAPLSAQAAVEAACLLHAAVKGKLGGITAVTVEAQAAAVVGLGQDLALDTPAARAASLPYMVAVALISGKLTPADYSDSRAGDPRLEALFPKLRLRENPDLSRAAGQGDGRALGSRVQVSFAAGAPGKRIEITYPLGHRQRRAEGLHGLIGKFTHALSSRLPPRQCDRLMAVCAEQARFEATPVHEFMGLLGG